MKKRFLFLLIFSAAFFFFAASCSDEEEDFPQTNTRCNSNVDCSRDSYCDLDNPQQDAELGMLVYYCRKRQLCATQADCPINWKCKINEGFCITNKEADGVLCKSNDDCLDPSYPKCNLATGECVSSDSEGEDPELPDSSDLPEQPDAEPDEDEPTDTSAETGDEDTAEDTDDDPSDPSVGKKIISDSFEDGGINWTIVPLTEGSPCWEITSPTAGPGAANVGSKVAATVLSEGIYLSNCKDLLHYNFVLDIPSAGKPEISFSAWVDLVASADYVEVLVKKEGEMWETTTGLYLSADTPSITSALDDTRTKITRQLGTAYYKFTGDISAYKGQKVEIGFRFVSDGSEGAAGFYLDDVTVSY
ncbi:immune inhibitor A [bacterium]|nr:immune inhibitor A [bacterium]